MSVENRLREIRELADAATPGPWSRNGDQGTSIKAGEEKVAFINHERREPEHKGYRRWYIDQQFIIHARTDVPRLVAPRLAALEALADAVGSNVDQEIRAAFDDLLTLDEES